MSKAKIADVVRIYPPLIPFLLTLPQMRHHRSVTAYRIAEAADLLGVSDDTVRRWADAGRLTLVHDRAGRLAVEGTDLAALVRALAEGPDDVAREMVSARNRFGKQ